MPKPRPTSSSRPTSTRTFAQFGALAAGALALLGSLSLEGCRKHDGTKPQPQVVTAAPAATPVLATSQQPGGTTALSDAPAGIDWLPGDHVEAALSITHGNLSQAARLLGIHRTTLYSRIQNYSEQDGAAEK